MEKNDKLIICNNNFPKNKKKLYLLINKEFNNQICYKLMIFLILYIKKIIQNRPHKYLNWNVGCIR